MYEEVGIMTAVSSAYAKLPSAGVKLAVQKIQEEVAGIVFEGGELFPPAPGGLVPRSVNRPMVRVVAEHFRQLFSGEVGRQAMVVLSASEESIVLGNFPTEEGRFEYGLDGHGPFRCFYPKKLPFRRRKRPTFERIGFEELCMCADDPREVYRATYYLLQSAAVYILGKQQGEIRPERK